MKQTSIVTVAACCAVLLLQACGGGGGGGSAPNNPSVIPPVAQTPNPGPPPVSQSLTCPSSGPNAQAVAAAMPQSSVRAPLHDDGSTRFVPGLYTVTYASDNDAQTVDTIAEREGAARVSPMHLDALGLRMRTVSVDPDRAAQLVARLKQTAGIVRVEQAQYRHMMSITANDPYYSGFGASAPYYETSSTPGQWDMHVINVESAWNYYSSAPVRGAPIAIIDTGVDVTHPDLAGGKVIRQACFVTYPSNAAQTTGTFAIDTDGHGTNVAGISDADTNNGFGFAGVAYAAPLLAYRIFPTTPSGGCEGSTNAQCSTTSIDEASAINDAVRNGARVINLSLGATPDSNGNCTDTTEYNAVEAAIANGVVVVAAAGNESKNALDCPAQYPGVIAVGAEGPGGGSASDSTEAVASYSNWLNASNTGSNGAYLVAPGGAATSSSDTNDLHYVENLTSSQMANASAYCKMDFAGAANDCRGGFAGTSQATPHVAGVASLILGLRSTLTPGRVAQAICESAHSIGDSKQGCGRLDAGAAVARALSL